jgi:hypothetical protein
MNVETKEESIIPFPIYTLSPDGKYGLSVDFRRINDMRPGYGYAGIPDPNKDVLAPENSGIYLVDMETGKGKFLISLADIAEIPYEYDDLSDAKHYFNHLLFNTDGSRFIFLHRWRKPGQNGFGTRMLTSDLEGKDIRTVDPYGYTSHFIWRDAENVLMWAYQPQMMKDTAAFYLIKDDDKQVANFVGKGVMVENGHCTYVPGTNKEWILNDTYPDKETRLITVFLYHVPTGKRVDLAKVYLPKEYKGEWRIDAHPRSSRDGKLVCIDSGCMGEGRQMIVMDISSIVGK